MEPHKICTHIGFIGEEWFDPPEIFCPLRGDYIPMDYCEQLLGGKRCISFYRCINLALEGITYSMKSGKNRIVIGAPANLGAIRFSV